MEAPTDKKLALFLCVNDNDQSFNFICSMLYSQAIEILSRMADTDFRDSVEDLTGGNEPTVSPGTKLAKMKVWSALVGRKLGSILKKEAK